MAKVRSWATSGGKVGLARCAPGSPLRSGRKRLVAELAERVVATSPPIGWRHQALASAESRAHSRASPGMQQPTASRSMSGSGLAALPAAHDDT